MKKTYNVKLCTETMGIITTTVTAENRRDAKEQVLAMAQNTSATEWYFELA